MTPSLSTSKILARPAAGTSTDTWNELVAAMPIVILYRALREVLQRRAHRRMVLDAFRR
jgi:hypothetical protein